MKNFAVVGRESTLHDTIHIINEVSKSGGEAGIAVVVDEARKVVGVVTDGDLRSWYCRKNNFAAAVKDVVRDRFVHVYEDLSPREQISMALRQMRVPLQGKDSRISKVVVTDRAMAFKGIVNLFDLYASEDVALKRIAVYGLGYVGLTLALTFAEQGVPVTGVDVNPGLLGKLRAGKPHFFEKGLESLLNYCLKEGHVEFKAAEEDHQADVHFIAVGTPVDPQGRVIFSYLEAAGLSIGRRLKGHDLVICRSTVPVGTTREVLIPILERESGLVAGKDFHVAFAPERTVEGNALYELKTLPQVVGGLTEECTAYASRIFSTTNPTVVKVEGLEAAEIVKLINNTFRDTVFAFANDIALLCDEHNISAFKVIKAATEGYPRNPIPLPSPGVGGICLVKDPHLYKHSIKADRPSFGDISRRVNEQLPLYVLNKYLEFAHRHAAPKNAVLMVGMAFKGKPETSDMRYSPSVQVAQGIKDAGKRVLAWDAIVPRADIEAAGFEWCDLAAGVPQVDAVMVMNNHPDNMKFDFYGALEKRGRAGQGAFLFFDGWSLFNKNEFESLDAVYYSTLGYLTKDDRRATPHRR